MTDREANQAIYEIFRGRELTEKYSQKKIFTIVWVLDNYDPSKSIGLDRNFCNDVVYKYEYLELDSGNEYYEEKHFRLFDTTNLKTKPYLSNKDMLRRNLRKVRMYRLLK